MQIKAKFFHRGVHMDDGKALSKDKPIENVPAPDIVAICTAQHIGKPALPLVGVGDSVKQGQLIAAADGFISANVHASVSGKVIAVEKRRDDRGALADYVVIENDKEYRSGFMPPLVVKDKANICARIKEAGVIGLGGAAFPTHVKTSPKTLVDTLIVNGAECEPYLTCDYRLMKERYEQVLKGIRYLAAALGVTNIVIGIEKNKPDCIERFSTEKDIQTVALPERYPMGSEKHLIYCCTGRKVPCGKLPADVGCVVQNVATAYAVYEAVDCGKPLFERVLTVSGGAIEEPKNLSVKNGTPFQYVIDYCGGIKDDCAILTDGGPMMGVAVSRTDVVTKKATSGILALTGKEADLRSPTPCIGCGRCAKACPMRLMPMDIDFYTQCEEYEAARDRGGVLHCIECGACAYSCPAKRPIVQSARIAKAKLRELNAQGKN